PKFKFFFFRAEDGIRYYKVTGVQTCALPICHEKVKKECKRDLRRLAHNPAVVSLRAIVTIIADLRGKEGTATTTLCEGIGIRARSEERRVGKGVDIGGGRVRMRERGV